MSTLPLLSTIRVLEDLPRLAEMLGSASTWQEVPTTYWRRKPGDPPACRRSAVIADEPGLRWYAVEGGAPARLARTIAGVLHRRGEPAAVLALDPVSGGLALSVAFDGFPVMHLRPVHDPELLKICLARIPEVAGTTRLAAAARLAEILSLEGLGERFFRQFERQLRAMAESLTHCRPEDRPNLALLQLNRVLFLYFVQSKGWLDGRPDFLRTRVDACLARNRGLDRHLFRPLFFGTLNRSWPERSHGARAFGRIPFLNGGLFQPHRLERRWAGSIPNPVWRDAFDALFERFHFTAAEGTGTAIAPDMLGRVFERVMNPEERERSGTFYTPPELVRALLEAGLARIGPQDFRSITLLDPAAGSGAFLLAALERLAELTRASDESVSSARRRVLRNNLFGVDINPTAVRLTELRLWLSVIAQDDTAGADLVEPLPNLDCLVRQGDSLTDPLGLIARMPFRAGAMGQTLAGLRLAVSGATGRRKSEAARLLRAAETGAMRDCLARAEQKIGGDIGELLRSARATDLFGDRRAGHRAIARSIRDLRNRLLPLRQARRRLEQQDEVGWFQYEAHFADVFARGGFDVVIGNPPWVRAERLPRVVREHLAGRYCWWKGEREGESGYRHQPDLAVAFLERAHELARPGGVVGLLVPAKLATSGYGAVARRALARDLTIHVLSETEAAGAAFDATVYPLAIVTSKERPGGEHRVRLSLRDGSAETVAQSDLAGGGPWIIRRAGAAAIARDLAQRFPSVGNRHRIHLGAKTGANDVFLHPPADIEGHLVREAFRGRDLRPFQVIRTIPILWPCDGHGRPLATLPPAAMAHIQSHRGRLIARSDQDGGPPWTVFRTAAAKRGPRVVWADLSRTLTAAPLGPEDRRIPLNTCYVVGGDFPDMLVLAAWLNSSWMRGLARLRADPARNGFARFNARTVAALPLPGSLARDPAVAEASLRAVAGQSSQAELDELTAAHLDLPASALRTLASVA